MSVLSDINPNLVLLLVVAIVAFAAFVLLAVFLRRVTSYRQQILSLQQENRQLREETVRHAEAMAEESEQIGILTRERDGYRSILDAAPFPIWRRNERSDLDWSNAAYSTIVEAGRDKVTSLQLELSSGFDHEGPKRLAETALQDGRMAVEERRFVVGGDRRNFRVAEVPLGGGLTAGFGQDITPEADARGQLSRHLEAQLEVLRNLATAIAIFGPDKRLSLANRAYARLWELDEEWLTGGPHFSEILELLRERRRLPEQIDWQGWKRSQLDLFGEIIDSRDELMHLPDGRTLRVSVGPYPFGGLLFTYDDVTRQLLLERATNTQFAVQRASLDNLYEAVAVYGDDGRLKLHNNALIKLWELDGEFLRREPHIGEVLDAARARLYGGKDWPEFRERVLSRFFAREARSGRFELPSGLVLDYAGVPLPDGAMLYTYLDVTDSTRIERALRERNEALQAADQVKSDFIANVSYALRTPLSALLGFAEVLSVRIFGPLNEKQGEYVEGIQKALKQLLRLVDDILDLATIETGDMLLSKEHFSLQEVFAEAAVALNDRIEKQKIRVSVDCPSDLGTIFADERCIRQSVVHLLDNAIKYSPEGSEIILGARREPGEVQIWVEDHGIGIAPSDRRRVFEKFQKGQAGSRRPGRHGGAGLGLALVRAFIERHDGHIELVSNLAKGTRITCHLPQAAG